MTEVATTKRTPGPVPHISNLSWEQARALLEAFLREQQSRYEALPTEHGSTHMGGSDDISGSDDPTTITPGDEADPGDPTSGFAPIGHTHGVSANLVTDDELSGELGTIEEQFTMQLKVSTELLLYILQEFRKIRFILEGKL